MDESNASEMKELHLISPAIHKPVFDAVPLFSRPEIRKRSSDPQIKGLPFTGFPAGVYVEPRVSVRVRKVRTPVVDWLGSGPSTTVSSCQHEKDQY